MSFLTDTYTHTLTHNLHIRVNAIQTKQNKQTNTQNSKKSRIIEISQDKTNFNRLNEKSNSSAEINNFQFLNAN